MYEIKISTLQSTHNHKNSEFIPIEKPSQSILQTKMQLKEFDFSFKLNLLPNWWSNCCHLKILLPPTDDPNTTNWLSNCSQLMAQLQATDNPTAPNCIQTNNPNAAQLMTQLLSTDGPTAANCWSKWCKWSQRFFNEDIPACVAHKRTYPISSASRVAR